MTKVIDNLYQKILFWLLAGLVIFIPLYPKFPLLNVPGTYVAIRLEDFFIATVIFLWIIYQIYKKLVIIKNKYFQIFLLFWFTGLISLISALLITNSVIPHLGLLHWVRRLEFMLLFWVAATGIKSKKQVEYLIWIFIITTLAVIFYGFGQLFLGFKVVSTVDKDFSTGILSTLAPTGRVNSTFAGQYDLAIYLSYFLIAMTGVFFNVKKLWKKLGIILVSSGALILLAYTASRISLAAAIIGIALVLFLLKKRAMIAGLVILSVLVIMIVPQIRDRIFATVNINIFNNAVKTYQPTPTPSSPGLTGIQSGPTPASTNPVTAATAESEMAIVNAKISQGLPRDIAAGEPTNYTELEVGRSASIRLTDEWPRAINALYKNPLLGTGYSSISLATDNDYLRALGETGVIGFLSLVLIFYSLLKLFISKLKTGNHFEKVFFIIIISIILDVLITGVFIDLLEASKVAILFWIIMGERW